MGSRKEMSDRARVECTKSERASEQARNKKGQRERRDEVRKLAQSKAMEQRRQKTQVKLLTVRT